MRKIVLSVLCCLSLIFIGCTHHEKRPVVVTLNDGTSIRCEGLIFNSEEHSIHCLKKGEVVVSIYWDNVSGYSTHMGAEEAKQ